MDSYYSSSSAYYYSPSCSSYDPSSSYLSESYSDPYCAYPSQSTPTHSSYYYPSYSDTNANAVFHFNHSTPQLYTQPIYPTPPTNHVTKPTPPAQSSPALNTTFESAPPPGRRRRQRTIFSKDQVDILDQVFEKNQYPDIQLREQLSERLDVPEARIQVWFKNRRSRARTTNKSKYSNEHLF